MAKRDKIFDNNFGSSDHEGIPTNYNLDPNFSDSGQKEDRVDLEIIHEEVNELIKKSEYQHYNEVDEKGNFKKLNKVDINKVYSFVSANLKHPKIEIFSVMSDYFDINYTKFYDSLSNKFKGELVEELENRGVVKDYLTSGLFGAKLF
jgi:hypothetical protein